MTCPRCKRENPADTRFCGECGTRLAAVCPTCRESNPPDNKFCYHCGAPLTPVAAEAAAAPRHTPKHLAEKILTSRTALEGERKQVTVLFSDLKGSMELLSDRDPEEARRILDPVLELMMEAVHRYEGTVNQVMGDGIMALFGAPVAHEDHALRSCLAALRMQESIKAYAAEAERGLNLSIAIRVGLNSGEVVVRSIGSDLHMDYTAVGQTTHLAARMEQIAAPGTTLITADVRRLAQDLLELRPLGPLSVKGLEQPVEVFELCGVTSALARPRMAARRAHGRFVGREADLRALRVAVADARQGHGRIVQISGEPGVGKSRLLDEFLDAEWGAGCLILAGGWKSYESATSYLPLFTMLRRGARIEEQDPPERIRERVTAFVRDLDETKLDTVPAMLSVLEALPADDPFRLLDLAERRRRVRTALEELMWAQTRRQPTILVLDNLQWVDAETQAFLDGLLPRLPQARLLLVLAHRPEYRHEWPAPAAATVLTLKPLGPAAAGDLLRELLGDDASLEALVPLLIERTDGNPFFLEETVRHLAERKALQGEAGDYRLATAVNAALVPATVQAVLAARIDRLPATDKSLLQALAVIGKSSPLALVQAIAEFPEDDLRQALVHLEEAGFLYQSSLLPDVEYTFKHGLTHEVAYGSMLRERRRALHITILNALEVLHADHLGGHFDRLAHHAVQGRVWAKALQYHRGAGDRALARAANVEAVRHFEQALEALPNLPQTPETIERGIDLRLALRPPLFQLGRLAEALSRSQEAEQLAQHLGDERILARVYTYLINHHYLQGEPDLALEYGARCLAVGESCNDVALQALARQYMGQSFHARGDYRRAQAMLTRNIEVLDKLPEVDRVGPLLVSYVASCGWLAFTFAELGEFDRAVAFADKGRAAAEGGRHPYSQMIAATLEGLVWVTRGLLELALLPLEQSLEASRLAHLAVWQPIPSSLLGLTFARMGLGPDALRLLRGAVLRSEELGVKAYLALWTTHLAEGLVAAGRLDEADETARRALSHATAHKERGHQALILHLLGRVAAAQTQARADEAERQFRAAMALAEELGMRPLVARAHLGLSELAQRRGDVEGAEAERELAMELARDMGLRHWEQEAPAVAGEGVTRRLLLVARWNHDLFTFLARELADAERVRVIEDRRHPRGAGSMKERREQDRRRDPAGASDLETYGVAVLPALS